MKDNKMKKFILSAAFLALCSTAVNALETSVAPKVTDIKNHNPKTGLIVGNSYSFYNCGVHGYLRGFTREAKQDWKARIITISSGRLSYHDVPQYMGPHEMDPYAKFDENGKLKDPMFDVVVLQGMSSEPIAKKSVPTFKKFLKEHVATIKAKGAEPIVVDTWARQDKPEDAKKLADSIISEANANDAIVLPVGLAFAESLKRRPDLLMHQSDKSHPTAAGSYLYGAMLYGLLFKKSPVGMKYLGECEKPLKPEDAKYLQELAWNVLTDFYGWKK